MAKSFLQLSNNITQFVDEHNDLVNKVGDLSSLSSAFTGNDSDIIQALNYISTELDSADDKVGNLADLLTTADSNAVAAINEVFNLLDSADSDLNQKIGSLASLTTTATSSLVAAINEVDSDVGDITTLTTDDKSSIVAAINEVDNNFTDVVSASAGGTFFGAVSFDADVTPDSDAVYDLGSSSKAWAGAYVGDLYLPEQASAPSTAANEGAVYTKQSGGQSELFYREESNGDEVQITNGGILNAVPSGSVIWFAANSPPSGWLECDGSAVSRTTYAALFAAIGTTFGSGDGSTTFNLPDLRGEFIRGWDNGKGTDSGRSFGSAQEDAFQTHTHTYSYPSAITDHRTGELSLVNSFRRGNTSLSSGAPSAGSGDETRPRNIALLPIIKY